MSAKVRMRRWFVVYRVKFSERWCADECNWLEEAGWVWATTKRRAQLEFRKELLRDYVRVIIGRHVSTTRC